MYYLAEFLNYYPLFKRKIERFVDKNLAYFYFENKIVELNYSSLDCLSIFEDRFFPQNWFICDCCKLNSSLVDRPQFPLANKTSVAEIDAILH
jgi:hypothetical protein